MKRRTQLRRSRMKRKPRRGDKPDVRDEYEKTHLTCACCFANWRTFGKWLECAHIIGSSGRKDDARNLLMLCNCYGSDEPRCHVLLDNREIIRKSNGELWPTMGLPERLYVKSMVDPELWDPDYLRHLYGKTLPELRRPTFGRWA